MQTSSDDELREPNAAVKPRVDAINAYLDENDHLKIDTYLGTLAEAAVEAGLDSENRQAE